MFCDSNLPPIGKPTKFLRQNLGRGVSFTSGEDFAYTGIWKVARQWAQIFFIFCLYVIGFPFCIFKRLNMSISWSEYIDYTQRHKFSKKLLLLVLLVFLFFKWNNQTRKFTIVRVINTTKMCGFLDLYFC